MAITTLIDRQYTAPAGADAVTVTPAAVAWTNSAYVEVLASTPAACVLTGVTFYSIHGFTESTAYDGEIDVATGAASSEVVIATVRFYSRLVFTSGQIGPILTYVFPIPIDNIGSGVRLSVRLRKNNTNLTVWNMSINYLQKPLTSTILTTAKPQLVIPPATVGVTVTAGGLAWGNGLWVQLRAATGNALVITGVVFGALSANADFEIDLGTGGSGSETVITTLRIAALNQGNPQHQPLPHPLDNVTASTRIAVRMRCSTASNTAIISLMVIEKPL